MTRINAGSTLANQYAPPFVVSDSVTTNWQLRYNATLLAFEAFDPSANVVAAGFDEIESQLFTNAVGQQTFVLPWVVDISAANPKASLYITIDGNKQHTSTYTITAGTTTTNVVLGAPATGVVEFIGLQTTGGATIELATAVGSGSAGQAVALTWLAPSTESLLITVEGVKQATTAYTLTANSQFTQTTVTFTAAITLNDNIEIVGITTTREIPASPVTIANLAGGTGAPGSPDAGHARIFSAKSVSGETQVFSFRDLFEGTNITLTEGVNSITIDSTASTFNNLGSGQQVIAPTPGTTAPLDFHSLNDGNRITLALAGGELTWSVDDGYVFGGGATINAVTGDRLIGVRNTGAPVTVNLLAIAELPAGDTITIKDESGGAATNNITVTPASETIDGNATHVISTNFGYVTLYSDGTDYFIIAQG